MIIAHFFLRTVRHKPVLYVETTSSRGLAQPSPAARALCEVSLSERRENWVRQAYYAFSKLFPDLILLDSMENSLRLESEHPSFDLVFRPYDRSEAKVTFASAVDPRLASAVKTLLKSEKDKKDV